MRFKPKTDKLFWIILVPTELLVGAISATVMVMSPEVFYIVIPIFLFVNYFFFSPLFGYVELRECSLFIKYGLILKREIPYGKIRAIEKKRCWYSDSMLSVKLSLDHVDIKYNKFDVTAVSVKENDDFIDKLKASIKACREKQVDK